MDVVKERLCSRIKRDWNALLFFGLLALASIYPVVPHFRSQIIGWQGDNVAYVYMTGWTGQALVLKQSPFVDPRLNYPAGLPLPSNDAPFLSMLLVAPATLVGGPVFGYNLVMLLSSLLSGYVVYLWVVRLTQSKLGALVGGSAFLLMPYRMTHGYGHLNLISTQALALFFLCLDRVLQAEGASFRRLVGVAAVTAVVSLSSQYYLVICLITGSLFVVATTVQTRGVRAIVRESWQYIAVMIAGGALGSLPYLTLLGSDVFRPYNIMDTRIWSAAVLDFVVPSRLHPLWGHAIEQLYNRPTWIEHTLYLGMVSSILGVIGLRHLYRTDRGRFWTWLSVVLVALVFALGTDLHLSNAPLQTTNPLWLPAYYLGHIPIVNLMRSWARFAIVVMLFVCVLAGVGTAVVMQRGRSWHRRVGTLCLALLILDLAPGRLQSSTLVPTGVDQWLRTQPGDFAVAVLPAGRDNFVQAFGSLYHAKHLPAFIHAEHQPAAFRDFVSRAAGFPDTAAVQRLRELHFRYLLIDRTFYDGRTQPSWQAVEQAMAASPYLRRVTDVENYRIEVFKE